MVGHTDLSSFGLCLSESQCPPPAIQMARGMKNATGRMDLFARVIPSFLFSNDLVRAGVGDCGGLVLDLKAVGNPPNTWPILGMLCCIKWMLNVRMDFHLSKRVLRGRKKLDKVKSHCIPLRIPAEDRMEQSMSPP